jgi:radical SAM superfamily enzyme YgiQ (UPF0313 family)
MKVLLIAANTERVNLPTLPLGPALVASATRAVGHEVTFLDLMGEPDPGAVVRQEIDRDRPDVIGVSVRNIDDQEMANPIFLLDKVKPVIAACRKASTAPVVLGGAGFTLFPAATLAELGADYGVCGEGEEVFPALLDSLEHGHSPGGLPGVYAADHSPSTPRAAVPNLDDLPLAGDELWAGADFRDRDLWVPVQTRRGCPYRCTYCSTPRIEGGIMRSRSPRRVAEQLERIATARVQRFQFVDNIFNIPRSYALELCREIRSLDAGLQWMCILYPRGVDEELARAMSGAGCAMVSLGFESGSNRILKSFGKRFDTAGIRRISDILADHGIRRFGFLLLGGPEETRDSVAESLDFVNTLDLDMLKVTVGIRIYPGTPLAQFAVEQGVISADDDLLRPRFYMKPGLEDWIRDQVAARGL